MNRTWSRCVQLQIVILLIATSFATHSNANPLGGVSGGRLSLPDRSPLEQRLDGRVRSTLSVNEAISIAEERYGGRAVGAKKIRGGKSDSYSVRILQDNGKIKNVIIKN